MARHFSNYLQQIDIVQSKYINLGSGPTHFKHNFLLEFLFEYMNSSLIQSFQNSFS